MSLTFIDFFAGIGGFRLGMEEASHKCIGYVEWDKFARKSYEAIHNTKGEWTEHDINNIRPGTIPKADVWTFGFPCQDISIASGNAKGLQGARSGLFYKTIDLLKSQKEEDKPKYLFIENVKNLFSVNGGWDFSRILISLDEAGYDAEWSLLNTKDFSTAARPVPQNRERVFIIGHSRTKCTRKVFPITGNHSETRIKKVGNINPSGWGVSGYIYDPNNLSPTLTCGDAPKILISNKQAS
ncbi:DNA (cytosine-5-)-methyltransferase [Bacillus cytotoxicus]|uniref:DNA cytosine methyltransferase n=1 Tax=Bacillus cereus group TaxID=86661 RepID=UPI000B9797EF|nr:MULTISPECIES: DNA (cytosine-5-)-methyltransferase [Bacillus cereus group]AWC31016.1 DNA (cytosine-5-)-methyltransferase [Bacillus cytotoxicus]AWC35036.1 DNA (cytosine-5-)-methyltransferase [Bacillus cytotoxicus]AWC39075.1 DNA (cytosine-5-)-methyltransferase [Bacillus cytotoxicus]AWC43108.1 DNA (cytosine-5-)-methyltransferase [Bacillus cytotoxicus]AWC46979.1 DNA (cytosine-5-)-methyltransferase [Bacillus cytotoxicus]